MTRVVWESLPERFPQIEVDEFVVMPNHFHGILVIRVEHNGGVSRVNTSDRATTDRATTRVAPTGKLLGDMIGAFKSITTHLYIQGVRQQDWPPFEGRLWQRNYWEHIIRDEQSYRQLQQYIQLNPTSWEQDSLHPNTNPEKRMNL